MSWKNIAEDPSFGYSYNLEDDYLHIRKVDVLNLGRDLGRKFRFQQVTEVSYNDPKRPPSRLSLPIANNGLGLESVIVGEGKVFLMATFPESEDQDMIYNRADVIQAHLDILRQAPECFQQDLTPLYEGQEMSPEYIRKFTEHEPLYRITVAGMHLDPNAAREKLLRQIKKEDK